MNKSFNLCVGTIGSGAWLSPDGGESWRRVGRGLWSESRVFGLTLHPIEPRTVFAGADDGIYRSQDGGQSFERLSSPMNDTQVWKIAVDPVDPDIIFAGTRPSALFRSRDGGRSWQQLAVEMAKECPNVRIPRVTALAVDPSDHRIVGWGRGRRGSAQHGWWRYLADGYQRHQRPRYPRRRSGRERQDEGVNNDAARDLRQH